MFRRFLMEKPLQASKLAGILLTLFLGFGGFFRIISADAVIDGPIFADGQFLAITLIPLISLALVCIVFLESLVTSFRVLRADHSLRGQLTAQPGYTVIRTIEAVVAIGGFTLILFAAPTLFSESLPAPAGVGLMLGLMVIGLGILIVSLVRTLLEVYLHAVAT